MVILLDFSNVLLDVGKGELDGDIVSLLLELREKGISRYLFTNISSEQLAPYEQRLDFKKYFDGLLPLSEYLKPDVRAYEDLQERVGYRYEDMIFIDDSAINIKVAESFGIRGIVFVGIEDLRERLRKFEVL